MARPFRSTKIKYSAFFHTSRGKKREILHKKGHEIEIYSGKTLLNSLSLFDNKVPSKSSSIGLGNKNSDNENAGFSGCFDSTFIRSENCGSPPGIMETYTNFLPAATETGSKSLGIVGFRRYFAWFPMVVLSS